MDPKISQPIIIYNKKPKEYREFNSQHRKNTPHTFDHSVFIGRFQPFHKGHLSACHQALRQSKHLIILVGSAFSSPSIRNPFNFEQRREMISTSLNAAGYQNKFTILPIKDFYYSDNAWTAEVLNIVQTITNTNNNIALIGHKKDSTSYYLDLFPKWTYVNIESDFSIHATDIRKQYFSNSAFYINPVNKQRVLDNPFQIIDSIEEPTHKFLTNFLNTQSYNNLKDEFDAIDLYKHQWSKAPYPPTFTTTDAVVTCCGHVLLVTRRAHPGKGLYALPGGFINQEETLENGCLRELREETKIKVPLPVLRGSIVSKNVFDHPLRSVRGRTITHAFYIQLKDTELPKVKGDDDAEHAFWLPLNEVFNHPEKWFEDHESIIRSFISGGIK